ncbi:MAG: alpha/beta hydrolase [Clostridia bacterium]|nr:alpha/beta hydrolase [Clostridia bacterium]
MAILQERVYLNEQDDWGYFDALCSLPTAEYKEKRRAMLVIPGGGYGMVSEREAEPIARKFYANGYNTFTLYYSVTAHGKTPEKITDKKTGLPKPLLEASKAMAIIRRNAEKYNIDPDKIAIIGFSAGGHLASSLATMWHLDFVKENAGIEYGENKPNAAILSYPVITSDKEWHEGSFRNLLNASPDFDSDKVTYSTEKQVSEKTCPCFLWHTASDASVPVENTLKMATALSAAKIPFEVHIFPEGSHGLSTAEPDVLGGNRSKQTDHVSAWVDYAVKWLEYTLG